MRTAMKSEKDLAKAGQDRAIPTSVATALTREIKDFLDDQAPLMVLMSSPGIQKVGSSCRSTMANACRGGKPWSVHKSHRVSFPRNTGRECIRYIPLYMKSQPNPMI